MQESRLDLSSRLARIVQEHPEWLKGVDARTGGLQSLQNVLRYAELTLIFINEDLSQVRWWTSPHRPAITPRQLQLEYSAYTQCSKFAIFHLAFAAAENTLRAILRALAPDACDGATAELKSIYECLFRSHLGMHGDELALLELLRLVRNTVHNEGQHHPRRSQPETLEFRGTRYEFVVGEPIEFVTWSFVIERVRDLVALLDSIAKNPKVIAFEDHIPYGGLELLAPAA